MSIVIHVNPLIHLYIKPFFIKLVSIVRLSVRLSIHPSSVHLSIYLLIHPFIYQTFQPITSHPSIYPTNQMSIHQFNIQFSYLSVHLTIHLPIHSLIYSPPHILQFIQASHLSNHSFTYPCIQLSIHFTNICWSMLRGPFWPQAWGCHSLPCEYVDMVGLASLLMLILLVHPHRHRLCLHRDRVPPECILHHHPGLGHILPIPVLSVGAALGTLQPHLEHTLLYGGHYAQEQEPVDHP